MNKDFPSSCIHKKEEQALENKKKSNKRNAIEIEKEEKKEKKTPEQTKKRKTIENDKKSTSHTKNDTKEQQKGKKEDVKQQIKRVDDLALERKEDEKRKSDFISDTKKPVEFVNDLPSQLDTKGQISNGDQQKKENDELLSKKNIQKSFSTGILASTTTKKPSSSLSPIVTKSKSVGFTLSSNTPKLSPLPKKASVKE